MPEEPQVESSEHQDDANIRHQPFQESVSKEDEIYTDDDGCHRHHVQHDNDLRSHFQFDPRSSKQTLLDPASIASRTTEHRALYHVPPDGRLGRRCAWYGSSAAIAPSRPERLTANATAASRPTATRRLLLVVTTSGQAARNETNKTGARDRELPLRFTTCGPSRCGFH
jgi:hypothetical protein